MATHQSPSRKRVSSEHETNHTHDPPVVTLRKRLASPRKGVKTRSFEDALGDLGKKYESARKR